MDEIINLFGVNTLKFDIRSNLTGSNLKVGIYNDTVLVAEITPNILVANVFQSVTMDLSAIADVDKMVVDNVRVTVVNADAENIFYLDNFRAEEDSSLSNVFGWVVSPATQDIFGMVSS